MKSIIILSVFLTLQFSVMASGSRRPPKAPKNPQWEKVKEQNKKLLEAKEAAKKAAAEKAKKEITKGKKEMVKK
ncbi:MAG: hypothetical protein HRT88_16705 [Lentisphaeraceae bacterium]|nr:hypothetical protein [Lentisphaeraceae bacterium]